MADYKVAEAYIALTGRDMGYTAALAKAEFDTRKAVAAMTATWEGYLEKIQSLVRQSSGQDKAGLTGEREQQSTGPPGLISNSNLLHGALGLKTSGTLIDALTTRALGAALEASVVDEARAYPGGLGMIPEMAVGANVRLNDPGKIGVDTKQGLTGSEIRQLLDAAKEQVKLLTSLVSDISRLARKDYATGMG